MTRITGRAAGTGDRRVTRHRRGDRTAAGRRRRRGGVHVRGVGHRGGEAGGRSHSAGGNAVAIQADSGDPEQVAKSIDETVGEAGRVGHPGQQRGRRLHRRHRVVDDGAVRPVGRDQREGRLRRDPARRSRIWATSGRIINIGSINADRVPGPGLSIYAMSKAAVAGLTRGLARDLGPRGITVNNIQPGPVATDMNPEVGEFADSLRR